MLLINELLHFTPYNTRKIALSCDFSLNYSTRNVVALHVRRTLNAVGTTRPQDTKRRRHYTQRSCTTRPQDTKRRRLYTALAHYAYNKVRTRDEIVA